MGAYMSCFHVYGDLDEKSLGYTGYSSRKDSNHFRYSNGRRFHNKKNCPYPLPNDLKEIDRLELHHSAVQHLCGRRFFAPLEAINRAIDVGTGTGIWMLEMAAEFPDCEFLGIDISPIHPTSIFPPNCKFELADIFDGIRKPDNWFDYVHQRSLVTAIPKDKWKSCIEEYVRICSPGGWVEIMETDIHFLNGGPGTEEFNTWVDKGFKSRGIDTSVVRDLDVLMRDAGLVDVEKHVLIMPFDDQHGMLGELFIEDFKQTHLSFRPLFTSALGVSEEQLETNTSTVLEEFKELRPCMRLYAYIGRKR